MTPDTDLSSDAQQTREGLKTLLTGRVASSYGAPTWLGLLLGLLIFGFYCLVVPSLIVGLPRLHELLFDRGIIQYLTMGAASAVLGDLLAKVVISFWVKRRVTSRLMIDDAGVFTWEELGKVGQSVKWLIAERLASRSAWLRRIASGLLQFARGDSKDQVRETLRAQAAVDESNTASTFQYAKVLVWAIPLFGFIGTVQGIGDGISNFGGELARQRTHQEQVTKTGMSSSTQDADMDKLKEALGKVTTGLGVAFDTTYLALIVTIALMLALTMVEKREMDALTRIEETAERCFVTRLPATSQMDSEVLSNSAARIEAASHSMTKAATAVKSFQSDLSKGLHVRMGFPES
jgi:biopolymer transport protein ExbB/TolQ